MDMLQSQCADRNPDIHYGWTTHIGTGIAGVIAAACRPPSIICKWFDQLDIPHSFPCMPHCIAKFSIHAPRHHQHLMCGSSRGRTPCSCRARTRRVQRHGAVPCMGTGMWSRDARGAGEGFGGCCARWCVFCGVATHSMYIMYTT